MVVVVAVLVVVVVYVIVAVMQAESMLEDKIWRNHFPALSHAIRSRIVSINPIPR